MKLSNGKVNEITKTKPWRQTIKIRRFKWFGRFMRLLNNAIAKIAFENYMKNIKKPRSQPQEI